MGEPAIVGDPVDEGPLRALTPERGERAPQGEGDVLEQVVALRRVRLIGGGEPVEGWAEIPQHPREPGFTTLPTSFTHEEIVSHQCVS
jgi:hypothetical protein